MDLCHDLIESERNYLERGARVMSVPGAVLVHMPAYKEVPAAAALHRINLAALLPDPLTWMVAIETVLADLGLARSRLILDRPAPELELALTMLGYRCRAETGLIRRAVAMESSIQLVPMVNDDDWDRKLELHQPTEDGPDGFALDPTRWVSFERAKHAAGCLTHYQAMRDGMSCGTVGIHAVGRLLWLKHLIVAPTHRRRGVGTAIVAAATTMAHTVGMAAVGCFVVQGNPAEQLFRSNGFTAVASQVGWDRALTIPTPARLAGRRVHTYS